VGAGVVHVLALEEDAGAAGGVGEPAGEVERRRPGDVIAQQRVKMLLEGGGAPCLVVGGGGVVQRGAERVPTETAPVRDGTGGGEGWGCVIARCGSSQSVQGNEVILWAGKGRH